MRPMSDDLDARVRRWLEADGPTVAPNCLVDAALAPDSVTTPRPAWRLAAIAGTALAAGLTAIVLVSWLARPAVQQPATTRSPQGCVATVCTTLTSQRFGPRLSTTIPESGWVLQRDAPSVLTIARSDDQWRVVTFVRRPTASVPGGDADEPGVGRTSQQLADWLVRNPEIDAGGIESTTIAGHSALKVDVLGPPSTSARSPACGLPQGYRCVSVLRYQAAGRTEELGVPASGQITMYFIDLPDGVLAIEISDVHLSVDQFAAWQDRASAVLEGLRFEP